MWGWGGCGGCIWQLFGFQRLEIIEKHILSIGFRYMLGNLGNLVNLETLENLENLENQQSLKHLEKLEHLEDLENFEHFGNP